MGRAAPGHSAEFFGIRRRGLVAALAAAALAFVGSAAQAAPVPPTETVITGDHLRLVSVTSPAMSSLSPGGSAAWDVGLAVTTPGEATVDVSLQVLSASEDTFEVEVARCDERWTAQGCPSAAVPLLDATVTAGATAALETTGAESGPWYRVTVTMVGEGSGAAATLRLVAHGAGEELAAEPGPGAAAPIDGSVLLDGDPTGAPITAPLPDTGTVVLGQLALAVGAVLSGLALAGLARARGPRVLR
jgi:hypothetical protein